MFGEFGTGNKNTFGNIGFGNTNKPTGFGAANTGFGFGTNNTINTTNDNQPQFMKYQKDRLADLNNLFANVNDATGFTLSQIENSIKYVTKTTDIASAKVEEIRQNQQQNVVAANKELKTVKDDNNSVTKKYDILKSSGINFEETKKKIEEKPIDIDELIKMRQANITVPRCRMKQCKTDFVKSVYEVTSEQNERMRQDLEKMQLENNTINNSNADIQNINYSSCKVTLSKNILENFGGVSTYPTMKQLNNMTSTELSKINEFRVIIGNIGCIIFRNFDAFTTNIVLDNVLLIDIMLIGGNKYYLLNTSINPGFCCSEIIIQQYNVFPINPTTLERIYKAKDISNFRIQINEAASIHRLIALDYDPEDAIAIYKRL